MKRTMSRAVSITISYSLFIKAHLKKSHCKIYIFNLIFLHKYLNILQSRYIYWRSKILFSDTEKKTHLILRIFQTSYMYYSGIKCLLI